MNPRKYLPDLLAILIFVVISFVYFLPAVWEGRILSQHDSLAGIGAGQEAREYYEQTGERTRWTNSIFGGMPTYQTNPSYDSAQTFRYLEQLYHLFLPDYVGYLFIMLLGFYILLRVMGISTWLALLGSILWAFSSYFFIIIAAGHIWKFITLAYIPPTIAGILLAYRGKYFVGGMLTAFFLALQIKSNHVQMSYYFLLVILCLVIAIGWDAWRNKALSGFFKASGVLVIAAVVGIAVNASNLYHTYQYSKETMRGKSELVYPEDKVHNQTNSGLNRDYITQWSYGIGETFSLMVPNVKGGASVPLAANEKAMEKANPAYRGLFSQLGQYWGDQPGTSGPVYVGAFVMFLFILGILVVRGPMKWALVVATVFSLLLSWGKNFMPFTDFFIDYIPMYSKFRAVSSILVIAEFTIPLLAILAVKEVVQNPDKLRKNLRPVYISLGLTGGLCLLFAVAPQLFFSTYIPAGELSALRNAIPADQLGPIVENLTAVRISIFTADAWRSFFVILIGTAILFAFLYGKLKPVIAIAGITLLCLSEMWSVNKRYLYDEQFVPAFNQEAVFRQTETDKLILSDPALDYRVLNLATNTFNENNTAYWHKSIGGYHAAKLRRYQELIDYHISPEMQSLYREVIAAQGEMQEVNPENFPVLNMLNTRYFIFPVEGGTTPLFNPYALGNGWFINRIRYVENANEELEALYETDPRITAVADSRFREVFNGENSFVKDSDAFVELIRYEPNRLLYKTGNSNDGVVVLSEIYYPGWEAKLDGVPIEIGRVNYVLRGVAVPAGEHTLELLFDPASVKVTETIAYVAIGLLLLGMLLLAGCYYKKSRAKTV